MKADKVIRTYELKIYPASMLRRKAKSITRVTDEIRDIMQGMFHVMRRHQGLGLAAPQIGLELRLAIVDTGEGVMKMVNPILLEKKGRDAMDEACLSLPSITVRVKRAKHVRVEYMNEWGESVRKNITGLTARAVQHEIDHLNGRLIVDYLPWFKRIYAKWKIKKT